VNWAKGASNCNGEVMKRTTERLAGADLKAFLSRVFHGDTAVDRPTADRLADATTALMKSARIKRAARQRWLAETQASARGAAPTATVEPVKAPEAQRGDAPSNPAEAASHAGRTPVSDSDPGPNPDGAEKAFDPYAFGLVPTYQREGAEGLAKRLADVARVDQLRQMARSQQIALPADIRRGEVTPEVVRTAIIKAVEKRISDRRAAAQ